MKHWKTKEEMGSGFQHTEKEHEENLYNSLEIIKPYEENTMRTKYLIRDCWKDSQLFDLMEHIIEVIREKNSGGSNIKHEMQDVRVDDKVNKILNYLNEIKKILEVE